MIKASQFVGMARIGQWISVVYGSLWPGLLWTMARIGLAPYGPWFLWFMARHWSMIDILNSSPYVHKFSVSYGSWHALAFEMRKYKVAPYGTPLAMARMAPLLPPRWPLAREATS